MSIEGGGVHSTSLSFPTTDATTDWPSFDSAWHVAVLYPNSGWSEDDRPIPRPDAHCLSGSALWNTGRTDAPSGGEWSPEQSRIIGVAIVWDQANQSLIATRSEVVRDLLIEAVREEFAYCRWLERGRPAGSDWEDWFAAVDVIPGLSSR